VASSWFFLFTQVIYFILIFRIFRKDFKELGANGIPLHALLFVTLPSNMANEVNCKDGGGGGILEKSANVIYFLAYYE